MDQNDSANINLSIEEVENLYEQFEKDLNGINDAITNLLDEDFDQLLIKNHIVTFKQFIWYAHRNISYAVICYELYNELYKKFMRKNLNLHICDLYIETVELLDKEIIDFFQYSRNVFEMMGQAINEGILCGKYVINKVYFHKCGQAIDKESFPKTYKWFEKIAGSSEYKYLTAFNNRTKHIGIIDTSYGFHLHNKVKQKASISSFSKEDQKNIFDKMDNTIRFTINSFLKFLEVFKDECVDFNKVDLNKKESNKKQHNKKECVSDKTKYERYHVKEITESKDNRLFAYIESEQSFDEMPDEIEVLFVKKVKEDNKKLPIAKMFKVKHILVEDQKGDIIGIYESNNDFVDDSIVHYLLYSKTDLNSNQIKGEEYSKEKFDNMTIGKVKEYGLPKKKEMLS